MARATDRTRARAPWPLQLSPSLPRPIIETRIGRSLLIAGLILAYVLAANLLAGRLMGEGYRLEIGTRPDRSLVRGFHGNERDAAGTSYRWTDGDATLTLRGPATREPAVVTLELGWLPPGADSPLHLYTDLDDSPWTNIYEPNQPRRYSMLLPPEALADGELRVGLRSNSHTSGGDPRQVGVRVDAAELRWFGAAWPLVTPSVLLAQAGIAGAWLIAARRTGMGWPAALAVAAALVAGLALLAAIQISLAAPWMQAMFGAGLFCAAVVWAAAAALPRLQPEVSEQFIRVLLLITLAALALRLAGVLFPTFISHDYLVNSGRLRNVQLGNLTLFDRPSEFSRNIAVVSPVTFLLAAPLSLIGDRALALQGLYSALDGLTPLLVGLLALRLGLGERAALLAAGLIALLPMQLTALYWGFVKQIVGQWLTLLLLLVAAYRPPQRPSGWAGIGLLAVITLLIHPGGLLLAGVCLGLWVLWGGWLALRAERAAGADLRAALLHGASVAPWRGWLITLAAACVVMLALQYADALRLMVGGLFDGSTAAASTNQTSDQAVRLAQIWVGLRASFAPMPLVLVGAGLAFLLYRASGPVRLLAASWTISAGLFLIIDIISGQQVRYAYFIAPLACCSVAALVEPVLKYRLGRAAALALVALVLLAGASLWIDAFYWGVKPSVNPLTH